MKSLNTQKIPIQFGSACLGNDSMLMSTANQPEVFVAMLYIGFIIGMVFDLFRSIRCVMEKKYLVNLLDILFWIVFTILFINELLDKNYGEFQFYCIVGVALGWCLYFITVSHIIFQLFYTITAFLVKVIKTITHPIQQFINKMRFYRACPEIFKERIKKGVQRLTSKYSKRV